MDIISAITGLDIADIKRLAAKEKYIAGPTE
jgi:hypothetical protein